MTHYFSKAPLEVEDFIIDYTEKLGVDTIATSTWTADTGITIDQELCSNTTTETTAWVSGGILDNAYVVTNVVTTAGGRTFEDSITISIVEN